MRRVVSATSPRAVAGTARFGGVLLEGRKGAAVEVPFDPAEGWGVAPEALWPGRRGHPVGGSLGGVRFESAIVPPSGRHWLLVDEKLRKASGANVGDTVGVVLDVLEGSATRK